MPPTRPKLMALLLSCHQPLWMPPTSLFRWCKGVYSIFNKNKWAKKDQQMSKNEENPSIVQSHPKIWIDGHLLQFQWKQQVQVHLFAPLLWQSSLSSSQNGVSVLQSKFNKNKINYFWIGIVIPSLSTPPMIKRRKYPHSSFSLTLVRPKHFFHPVFVTQQFCTSLIMVICGIGWRRWGTIIQWQSLVIPPHGNVGSNNATIKLSFVYSSQEHFEELKKMADVSVTRTVREMSGKVMLQDNNDDMVYLPSWMSKRECYEQYC